MKTILATVLAIGLLTACTLAGQREDARIRVYKPDGSRQCEEGSGIGAQAMKQELHGIRVYAAEKQMLYGVMFPTVCGGQTGNINVYTIAAKDQAEAQKRGFAVLPESKHKTGFSID
ncbi:MAG: hypothetical protein Q4C79_06440 [Neisseria sp.]|uniref:hypothetical protein n=1 Tax=Neisseria sp. TaxID=192066 RepID=UPI0026DC24B9|nr:hypothetical protein [Neisseria sp.]MDO4248585.1 hypothetical protein [Neisseria sp.]